MPEPVANAAEALTGPLRTFLARPHQEGLFLHCAEDGVDLVVQVIAEAPAGLAGDCPQCKHRARFERGRVDVKRVCPICRATLGPLSPVEAGEKFNVFAWRVSWSRAGYEGLGYGPTIDEGRFTDGDVLSGISQMHGVLRLYLPLFDSLNVTTMKDYRALTGLRPEEKGIEVQVRRPDPKRY